MYIKPVCASGRVDKVTCMDENATDHAIVEARANLSDLLATVRKLRVVRYLTSRGKRQVALVPHELGELVERAGGPDKAAEILRAHLSADPQ
jgi:hypothetical protein